MELVATKQQKLSAAQERVMSFMGHGWTAYPGGGCSISINGARICNIDTMMSLSRMGLVVSDADRSWKATEKGRELTHTLNLGYKK
jgi:hypothetical protein